jgi:uncharacterized membrane protein YgcG
MLGRRRLTRWLATASLGTLLMLGALAALSGTILAAGPPYPAPVDGQRVYDTAGVFSEATIAQAEEISRRIEARTGAQVVVYTQLKPESDTPDLAEADAIALIDQWGIGRKGFDDGLVILFDLDESLRHGQVRLTAGPGYRATYLSNDERNTIYQDDMLPLLRGGDLDGALLAALAKVDAATTAEHAADLGRGRIVNAILGLIVGPGVFVLLVGWVGLAWRRTGRDPDYGDDPSILMPAPPVDLSAATGALVYDGKSSRRTLTTALLDLASRGELAFQQDEALFKKKVSIRTEGAPTVDEVTAAQRRLNARKPLGDAEMYALDQIRALAPADGLLADADLLKFGAKVSGFDDRLEAYAVDHGWFREAPGKAIGRWSGIGGVELIGGAIALFAGIQIPFSGLVVLGGGLLASGVVTLVIAQVMPARTRDGAIVQAMLAAYRRTLQKTMEQARSMGQVVDEAKLAWIETPDQAMVWATALGLQSDAESVLERSREDAQGGRSTVSPWFPLWYGTSSSFAGGGGGGGGGSMFSASPVPDFGGMFSVLGSVGNSPSSSGGSGGGGGFGGGGSGGGGGGAGGGF